MFIHELNGCTIMESFSVMNALVNCEKTYIFSFLWKTLLETIDDDLDITIQNWLKQLEYIVFDFDDAELEGVRKKPYNS